MLFFAAIIHQKSRKFCFLFWIIFDLFIDTLFLLFLNIKNGKSSRSSSIGEWIWFKRVHEKLRLPDEFEEWLKDIGLLHRARKCPFGAHEMIERLETGRRKWVCRMNKNKILDF